jgi:hypothetical protein
VPQLRRAAQRIKKWVKPGDDFAWLESNLI